MTKISDFFIMLLILKIANYIVSFCSNFYTEESCCQHEL